MTITVLRRVCAAAAMMALMAGVSAAVSAGAAQAATEIPAADIEGAGPDSPILSRFAGSVIIGYRQADYDTITLPLGGYHDGDFDAVDHPEGRVTQIAYAVPRGKTVLDVYRSFESAMAEAGFSELFQCEDEGCGGYDFSRSLSEPVRNAMPVKDGNLVLQLLSATSGNLRALSAELDRPEGRVQVSLMVVQHDDDPVGVLMQVVESAAMQSEQVTVDAAAMSQGLALTGHVALYGLEFATDSAELQPGSEETLAQMAELLKGNEAMKVFIVGHTDTTGPLAHNLALSKERAEAVVSALESRYGVSAERMEAEGVGPFAPLASNDSDAGRQQNRRVELVRQ